LKKGDIESFNLPLKNVFDKISDLDSTRNLIVVQIQNEVINSGNSSLEHLIDVTAQVVNGGKEEDPVDIRDVILKESGKETILHYIIYDLCNIDKDSKIEIEVKALDGEFTGFISAEIVDMAPFSAQCLSKDSEIFRPRQQHAACETWDGSVWVYGGKHSVEKSNEILGDIMTFDSLQKTWRTIKPSTNSEPVPRFGHVMMCYFNYLIVFGGQDKKGKALGDLWVFDIAKEQWKFIMNTEDTHEIGRLGVEGFVPSARMFSTSIMSTETGTGFIIGGMLNKGVACDIWSLNVDRVISYVEDKYKSPIINFWEMREIKFDDQNSLCRYSHSAVQLSPKKLLVYGGIYQNGTFVDTVITYDITTQKITILQPTTKPPEPRLRTALLSTGNQMVIMYGGSNLQNDGYYSELWHLVVRGHQIEYIKVAYQNERSKIFMNWRHGFTLHNVRHIKDPILIGGTYGNNQQSKVLMTLPEQK
jgi:hypothetical protein